MSIRVLFVCLGNICRSPMAEFIFKDKIAREGLSEQFIVESAGTSSEEEGNPVYPPARAELAWHNISCAGKRARRVRPSDYTNFDYILAAEARNVQGCLRIFGGDPEKKVFRMLDFSSRPRDISDPWWTGDFAAAYRDIDEGTDGFLRMLSESGKIPPKNFGGGANNG